MNSQIKYPINSRKIQIQKSFYCVIIIFFCFLSVLSYLYIFKSKPIPIPISKSQTLQIATESKNSLLHISHCLDLHSLLKTITPKITNPNILTLEKRYELLNFYLSNSDKNLVKNKIENFLRELTDQQNICLSNHQLNDYDIYEIFRYRYLPNTQLNHVLSEKELTQRVKKNFQFKGSDKYFIFENNSTSYYEYKHKYSNPCYRHFLSLKYMPECGDDVLPDNYRRKMLIIAVQRSGTHFVWEMLNRLNIDVHHEGVGGQGAVSWLYAVNAFSTLFQRSQKHPKTVSHFRAYAINNPERLTLHRFEHVFHQVRHPLRVISSLISRCYNWDYYWEWISVLYGFELITEKETPLRRSMLLYLLWNKHIELYADVRYRAESTSVRHICRWAGYNASTHCNSDLTHTLPPKKRVRTPYYRYDPAKHHRKNNSLAEHYYINKFRFNRMPIRSPNQFRKEINNQSNSANFTRSLREENNSRFHESRRLTQAILLPPKKSFLKAPYHLSNNHLSSQASEPSSADNFVVLYDTSKALRSQRFFERSNKIISSPNEYQRQKVTWDLLDKEDLILSNEIRIMCLEYGFPLDESLIPQNGDTFQFNA